MALAWLGYTGVFWGYSLVSGWNLSFSSIVSPTAYYGSTGQVWPPPTASNTVVFPNGSANDSSANSANVTTAASTTADVAPGLSGGSGVNGIQSNGAAILSAVKTVQPAWSTGQQWTCLVNVINRESGGNLTAQNPSSNAYGIAQFINGAGEYATYGGNATTVLGQMTAMINYISQRYGSPCAAWQNELSEGYY
jgi:hypothetical protein